MAQKLNLPDELSDMDNVLQLLTIVFPTHSKKIKPTIDPVQRKMLICIFAENSAQNRLNFFSNPLVQFIWTNYFLKESADQIHDYLRRTKGYKHGHLKVSRFIEEIKGLERQSSFKILPDSIPRSVSQILPFEPKEELEYLTKNGHYNKKYRDKVKEEI